MSRWTASDIPDQAGRTAVVTGGNTGLGLETARALSQHGATVVLACRDMAKADQAAAQIGGDTSCVQLDLASLASVREAAAQLRSRVTRIDLLVNNAGVMMKREERTEDGFELQFGTNYLGHFALTGLLLDLMTRVAGSRVVMVSSPVYVMGRYPRRERFRPMGAYSDSKLANLLFALELQRRLADSGAETSSLAAHPGYSETELLRHQRQVMQLGSMLGAPLIGQSAAMGALPLLRALTDPAAQGGEFYRPQWQMRGYPVLARPLPKARDTEAARRLWAESEDSTHVTYNLNTLTQLGVTHFSRTNGGQGAAPGALRAERALSSQRDTGSPTGIAAMSARTHRASAISGDLTNDAETGVASTIVKVSRFPSNAVLTVSNTVGTSVTVSASSSPTSRTPARSGVSRLGRYAPPGSPHRALSE